MREITSKRDRLALPRSLPVLLLIWLSAIGVSSTKNVSLNESSSGLWLRKCCPPRKIYTGQSEVDCMPGSSLATELHPVSRAARLQSHGIPNCDDPEDIETTPLSLIGRNDDRVRGPACLEILRKESSSEDLPIVVHCRSNRNDTEDDVVKLSTPRVVTVRRCCPKDMLYEPRSKTCVDFPIFQNENVSSSGPSEDPFLSYLPSTESIDFLTVSRGPPDCRGAIFDYRIDTRDLSFGDRALVAKLSLNPDGWLQEEIELTEDNACLELTSGYASSVTDNLILRLCREEEACRDKPCVAKCCPEGQYLRSRKGCNKFDDFVESMDFHKMLLNVSIHEDFFKKDYGLLVGKPCKFGMYRMDSTVPWTMTSKGHIKLTSFEVYKHRDFCMDIYNFNDTFQESVAVFVCFEETATIEECNLRCTVQIILESISCVFLLITLVVYACLPALQNLHGKTLMCHVASLLSAYVCLVMISLLTPKLSSEAGGSITCAFLGYIMLFSFLAAFAWLNVMCFDIWWTFGGLRNNISTRGRGHRKRFLLYSAYAWGIASLITFVAIIVDQTDFTPIYLQPGIGRGSCWFTSGKNLHGEVIFFIGPVTLQTMVNIVLFLVTIVYCNKVKAEIHRVMLDPSDARNKRFQANRTKLIMNIKLFVVMGISWITESVSYFLNTYAKDLQWREELFYASDVFNALQGLLIFVLFVLKSRVYHALRRRLGFEEKKQGSSNTTTVNEACRINKSVSNSTLMSTFQVSSTP